jgi:broad specificity phosphatase PhoE
VKRRAEQEPVEPPERLRQFTASDWPGSSDRERFDAWKAARADHAERYGWPDGDLLDRIAGEASELLRHVSGRTLDERRRRSSGNPGSP